MARPHPDAISFEVGNSSLLLSPFYFLAPSMPSPHSRSRTLLYRHSPHQSIYITSFFFLSLSFFFLKGEGGILHPVGLIVRAGSNVTVGIRYSLSPMPAAAAPE